MAHGEWSVELNAKNKTLKKAKQQKTVMSALQALNLYTDKPGVYTPGYDMPARWALNPKPE